MGRKIKLTINILHKTISFIIVFFLSIQYAISVHPSQLIFNKITSSDGLLQNTIKAIHQDSKGFTWFGTENGISRYDGYEFINYYYDKEDENTLSSPFIRDIDEDKNEILWIATRQGLNRYDPRINKFTRIYCNPDNIHALSNKINIIYVDNNILWMGTSDGLFKLDIETNIINKIIEHSYRDEDFNVEKLANQVHLSERALLYKIKGLLGKSPNEFIREYRLNRAKNLILSEKINVADLAEHVGFGNASYFHKCFKAYVGCTPKQFIQSNTRH